VPVFIVNGAGADLVADVLGVASPGLGDLVAASLLGGLGAMLVVLVIAYYGTIVTVRLGIDPDTYGIPMVSSTVDLVGALSLVVAIAVLGLS
jgi:mgtE-like transporter